MVIAVGAAVVVAGECEVTVVVSGGGTFAVVEGVVVGVVNTITSSTTISITRKVTKMLHPIKIDFFDKPIKKSLLVRKSV